MAYFETFYARYQREGVQYRIELHELKAVGSTAIEIESIMPESVVLKRRSAGREEALGTVLGSELEFNFYSTVDDASQFDQIYEGEWKEWKVKYYKDSVLIWEGYVKSENINRPFVLDHYELSISATDGLADLKGIEFVNFSTEATYSDRTSLLRTVKRCLEHLEIELDFKIQLSTYETNEMVTTECALSVVTLDSTRFTNEVDGRTVQDDCLTVLEETLRVMGVSLFQDVGYWWIQAHHERYTPIFVFDWSTITQQSRTITDMSLDISSYSFESLGDFQRLSPIKKHEVTFQNILPPVASNVVPNGDFATNTDWTMSGMTSATIAGGEYSLVDSSGTGYVQSGDFELASIPSGGELTVTWQSKNVSQVPSGDPFYSPIIRCKLFYGATEVTPGTTDSFFLFEGAEYITHSVIFPVSVDAANYRVRFYLEENVTLYTSVNVKIDDVLAITNYENPSETVTDRVTSVTNDDIVSSENTESIIWFGDTDKEDSEGVLKVGAVVTSDWSRYTLTDNKSIQELYALGKVIERRDYKNYLRVEIQDPNDNIKFSHRILVDSIYYIIQSYSKTHITRQITLDLVEQETIEPTTSTTLNVLTSIDGNSTSEGGATTVVVAWDNVLNTPYTLAGYGITDAYTQSEITAAFAAIGHTHTGVYEPYDTAIVKSDEAETISSNWEFSGSPIFSGVPDFTNLILPFAVASGTGMVANLDSNYLNGKADSAFELAIGTKNTAFNKNFGTTGTTVAYGDHTHSGFTQDSANEVISGAWTFTGIAEFGVAPQFTAAGTPFTVTSTTVVTNLNADRLDGNHSSAFATSSHTHTGVYEPADADITKRNEAETVTANWTFSGTPIFSGVPNFSNAALPFSVNASSGMVSNLDANYLNGKADSAFELAIGTKNTAFNKNFGTTSTTVAYGNHTHSGFTQDSANEVISGAWTFTGAAEFGVRPTFSSVVGAPFIVSSITASVVTNLNADKLDGYHSSSFSLSGHTHTGVYEPADADITKRNEVETITANWIFSNTPEFTGVPDFSNSILPFTVHSNANLVTNLNADLLDGFHSTSFARLNDTTPTSGYFYVQANTTNAAIRARQDGTGYLQDWYDGATQRAYMTQAGLLVSDDFKGLSDERLKDKFKKVNTSKMYKKVLKISNLIRRYERIDKNNELELGWGAQTLYKVAPEYVHKPDDKEEMWAVSYGKMVVPLYAAIASIDKRLERIEKRLKL